MRPLKNAKACVFSQLPASYLIILSGQSLPLLKAGKLGDDRMISSWSVQRREPPDTDSTPTSSLACVVSLTQWAQGDLTRLATGHLSSRGNHWISNFSQPQNLQQGFVDADSASASGAHECCLVYEMPGDAEATGAIQ